MRSPVRGTTLPPASFFINRRGRPLPHAVRSCGPADLGGHIPSRPSKTTKPPTWRGRHIGGARTARFHSVVSLIGHICPPDNGGQPSREILRREFPAGSLRLPAGTPRRRAHFTGFPRKTLTASGVFSLSRNAPVTSSRLHVSYRPENPGLVSIIIHFRKKSTPIFRPGCHRQNIDGPPTRTGIPTPGSAPPTPK